MGINAYGYRTDPGRQILSGEQIQIPPEKIPLATKMAKDLPPPEEAPLLTVRWDPLDQVFVLLSDPAIFLNACEDFQYFPCEVVGGEDRFIVEPQ